MSQDKPAIGLVLSGGGARAAYQVGVLKAVSELMPPVCFNPFPVICGTSAGGLNAAGLACRGDCLQDAVAHLEAVWSNFRTHQVYRTDWPGVLKYALRFLWTVAFGRLRNDWPVSLLDNSPLRDLLGANLALSRIGEIIEAGYLQAVCITASGYTSGESVSFFRERGIWTAGSAPGAWVSRPRSPLTICWLRPPFRCCFRRSISTASFLATARCGNWRRSVRRCIWARKKSW